jgi:hypothetical protein
MNQYPGLFKDYTRHGRAWLATLPAEVRRVFSEIGRIHAEHGHRGGLVRAQTGKRDEKGRFTA